MSARVRGKRSCCHSRRTEPRSIGMRSFASVGPFRDAHGKWTTPGAAATKNDAPMPYLERGTHSQYGHARAGATAVITPRRRQIHYKPGARPARAWRQTRGEINRAGVPRESWPPARPGLQWNNLRHARRQLPAPQGRLTVRPGRAAEPAHQNQSRPLTIQRTAAVKGNF